MKLFLLLFLLMNVTTFAQADVSKYSVFDGKGNPKTLERIVEQMEESDVVFLGENHDDAIAHALEMQIFKAAFDKYAERRKVTLSMEMFERDVQTIVNEYLNGLISEVHFLASSRPWGNYETDYRPLVEFAKENRLEVVAANAPRRYVNMVTRAGRDSLARLSPEAKNWLAPLPYGEPSEKYSAKFDALMGQTPDPGARRNPNSIVYSQALWDATMAYSIAESLKKNKNPLVVHLNGAFHTENRLGTVEHLLKYRPNAKILVVTIRYEDDFKTFDKTGHTDLGDFVILTEKPKDKDGNLIKK